MNFLHILPTLSAAAITGLIGGFATQNPIGGVATAVPAAIVASQVAERKNDAIEREIQNIRADRDNLVRRNERLNEIEIELGQKLEGLHEKLKIALETARKAQEATVAMSDLNDDLECQLAAEKVGLEEAIGERDEAIAQLNDYRDSFQSELEAAIAEGLEGEYKRQLAEMWEQAESLINRSLNAAKRMKKWGAAAMMFNDGLHETATNLETNTERALNQIYGTLSEEKETLRQQIELLNLKLAKKERESRGN